MRLARIALLALSLAACGPRFQVADADWSKNPWARRFVDTGGGFRLHYDVIGQGSPILFLHGFTAVSAFWFPTAQALKDGHASILVDLPGHGLSDRKDVDYSPAAVARRLAVLLDHEGYKKVSIVGHSWGGAIALAFADLFPDRVDRLVLVDAWIYSEQANTFMRWSKAKGVGEALALAFYDQQLEYRYALAFDDPDAWMDEKLTAHLEKVMNLPGSKAAALAIIRTLSDLGPQERRYGAVRAPALCVWCRGDQVSPLHYGERVSGELPEARLEVLENCNHMPTFEQPRRLLGLLREFLK